MIDIHEHILPGLDDGAEDMGETLEMARIAIRSGISAVVATPHCNVPGIFDNYWDEEYRQAYKRTVRRFQEEGIDLKVYPGMEVFATPDIVQLLADKKILTLNGSRYMLVEFAFDEDPGYVEMILNKLLRAKIVPVIAHPERYELAQDCPQYIYEWRKKGCLVQVNKGSLLGRFGRSAYKAAHKLLSHNLISVIASDAHGYEERSPWMREVYGELSGKISPKQLQVLFYENANRICQNQPTIRFELKGFEEEELE